MTNNDKKKKIGSMIISILLMIIWRNTEVHIEVRATQTEKLNNETFTNNVSDIWKETNNSEYGHVENNHHEKQLTEKVDGSGVILTSYMRFAQDPRARKKVPKPTFGMIYHFWVSVIHHRLHAIIFYDRFAFDDDFIERYSYPPYIRFVQVDTENTAMMNQSNPNDYRFTVFRDYLQEHPYKYDWYLIADRDVIFNRDPFVALEGLRKNYGNEFVGSFDGGNWRQGKQYPTCFETPKSLTLPPTPNGNCGLWAGRYKYSHCILECMADTLSTPPVMGKGNETPCDMAVYNHCVMYGGCFPNTTKDVYAGHLLRNATTSNNKKIVRWGSETLGTDPEGRQMNLFGPTVQQTAERTMCVTDQWTVTHNRCGKRQRAPICFNHSTLSFPLREFLMFGEKPTRLDDNIGDNDKGNSTTSSAKTDESKTLITISRKHQPLDKYLQFGFPITRDGKCILNLTSGMPMLHSH